VEHFEKPGRGRNGEPLGYWWLDQRQPDLLDLIVPDRSEVTLILALDANVFFDLEGRERTEDFESRGLLADWLQPQIELCVTPELLNEIGRNSDAEERARLHSRTNRYRMLKGDDGAFWKLVKELDEVLGPAISDSQQSDRRQLARAAAGDADHFITRDGGLLDKAAEIYAISGLSPLRPSELIAQIDPLARAREYQPARLAGSHLFSDVRVSGDVAGLADIFLNNPAGERRSRLLATLRRLLANPEHSHLLVVRDNQNALVALLGLSETSADEMVIEVARVAGGKLASTLARQLLDIAVKKAGANRRVFCRLADPHPSAEVLTSSTVAGFRPAGGARLKVSLPMVAPITDIAQHLRRLAVAGDDVAILAGELASVVEQAYACRDVAALFAAERLLRPAKLSDLQISNFIVPINAVWAAALFDEQLASGELFAGSPDLMFRGENAYYSARRSGRITAPGRVLWYVKHAKHRPGSKAIRAVSYLDEVVLDSPKHLFRRFQRLGVYEWRNLFELAKGDVHRQIMALVFSDTELLPNPIPFQDMQEELVRWGMARNQIQSPLRIPCECFLDIYARGCQ
jgi:hypothetical protein